MNSRSPHHGDKDTYKVNGRLRVNNALAAREMMLSGQGIGLCPTCVIGEEVRHGRLQLLLQEYELFEQGVYAVYPHKRHSAATDYQPS